MNKSVLCALICILAVAPPTTSAEWSVLSVAGKDSTLSVVVKEKYGPEHTIIGKVVFENGREYRISAPWITGACVINRDNIVSITIEKRGFQHEQQ